MDTIVRLNTLKAARRHTCTECNKGIKTGSWYTQIVDGKRQIKRIHLEPPCERHKHLLPQSGLVGFPPSRIA